MSDPLSSWNDGPAKAAILDFVARVTGSGPEHIPAPQRIATFDNDGTLWAEQPLQTQFLFGRMLRAKLIEQEPELAQQQPFKAYVEQDMPAMKALGKLGLLEVAAREHAGATEEEFDRIARDWLATAHHPLLDRPFTRCVYRPQIELLDFLRAHDFKTYIVSGGGLDLMRAFAEDVYGIPPEQVIGSSLRTRFEIDGDGVAQLVKLPELHCFDDREAKAQNIALHIGRRPILAFGNSDGDLAMLRYVKTGSGPRLALLLHHDDAAREFAYDRDFFLSPLAEALDKAADYGLTLVSMKQDWNSIFV